MAYAIAVFLEPSAAVAAQRHQTREAADKDAYVNDSKNHYLTKTLTISS